MKDKEMCRERKLTESFKRFQQEYKNLTAENAKLKDLLRQQQILAIKAIDIGEELIAQRKKWNKILLGIHNCESRGNHCDKHIDEWCDFIGSIMEEELESGSDKMVKA
jgi:hypothetical protein